MATVVIPLPDRDFDVTEVAVPWKPLTAAGHDVVFATEAGARPAADPRLLTGVVFGMLGAEPEAKAFYGELERAPAFDRPIAWRDIDLAACSAMLLPGGHAKGMRQYLEGADLFAKVAAFARTGKPLARDLPRRARAGASARPADGKKHAGRPPDDLPAQVHGALRLARHGLEGRPLLPDVRRHLDASRWRP